VVSRLPGLSSNPIYFRLTIVLAVVLAANAIWAGLSILGVDLQRVSQSSRKQVGEIFSENYEVINRSYFPKAWLKVTDLADMPGGGLVLAC